MMVFIPLFLPHADLLPTAYQADCSNVVSVDAFHADDGERDLPAAGMVNS